MAAGGGGGGCDWCVGPPIVEFVRYYGMLAVAVKAETGRHAGLWKV